MKSIPRPGRIRESETHQLIAGVLCLDFANTVNGHTCGDPHEYLLEYQDLVLWSRHVGVLTPEEAARMLQAAAQDPVRAEVVYHQAKRLREVVFRLFSGLATGSTSPLADLTTLNEFRIEALRQSCIVRTPDGFSLARAETNALEQMLWPIALSAADLVVSEQAKSVRLCSGEGCDWLFLDTSRNHLRRWCSMDACGNRSKMQRRSQRARLQAV